LFEDLGTFHSDFKKIAQNVVKQHWDWELDEVKHPEDLVTHVLTTHQELMADTKYIHGDELEDGAYDNFSSKPLQDLCVTGIYAGKSSLATSFPDIFCEQFPLLTAALDDYSTGIYTAMKLRHNDYSQVNEEFMDMINSIKGMSHHA
ncbi:hypothetical protein PAXRUDRAFT_174293, partial [Paxillus rubicundulus Ve08.2h10]